MKIIHPKFIALPLLIMLGCSGSNNFLNKNKNNKAAIAPKVTTINSEVQKNGDWRLPCFNNEWVPLSKDNSTKRIKLPLRCERQFGDTSDAVHNLDIVFVLDVTGSMRNELSVVRHGINNLLNHINNDGWIIHAGAIAFADEILAALPLQTNLQQLLDDMSPTNPIWSASDGFGGDISEVGLSAIEQGINLLSNTESQAPAEEKILVYVSDAPMKKIGSSDFTTQGTSLAIQNFVKQLDVLKPAPSFRLYYSSSSSRKGLDDNIPTPINQIREVVNGAAIANVELPFPLNTQNFSDNFEKQIEESTFVSDVCYLKKVTIINNAGITVLQHLIVNDSSVNEVIFDLPKITEETNYMISTEQECSRNGLVILNAPLSAKP